MSPEPDPSARSRSGVLATAMLGILVASVAGAYVLVESKQVPVRAAAELLREIRQKGLPGSWDENQTYILLDRHKQPIGSKTIRRIRDPFGRQSIRSGFRGKEVRVSGPDQVARVDMEWGLSDDGKTGEYASKWRIGRAYSEARIELGARLRVTVSAGGLAESASTEVPENYMPEDLTFLLVGRVATRGTKAVFLTIVDDESVLQGRVHFATLTLTPESPTRVRGEINGIQARSVRHFSLDEKGGVCEVEDPETGVVCRRVVDGLPDADASEDLDPTMPAEDEDAEREPMRLGMPTDPPFVRVTAPD